MGMPAELQLLIVEAVTDKQDIISLCRTSRWLLSVVQPELLKRYTVYIQRRSYYTSFLNSIIMRPFLGAHIKELHFWLFKRHEPNPCCFDGTEHNTFYVTTCWACSSAPPVDLARTDFIAAEGDIEDNDGEAVLITLLQHLPKLEVLSVWLDGFEVGQAPKPRLLASFFISLAANPDPSRPLVNLKEATFAVLNQYRETWGPLWTALARSRLRDLLWTEQRSFWIYTWASRSWNDVVRINFDLSPKERAEKYGRYSQQTTRMSYADLLKYVRRYPNGSYL